MRLGEGASSAYQKVFRWTVPAVDGEAEWGLLLITLFERIRADIVH